MIKLSALLERAYSDPPPDRVTMLALVEAVEAAHVLYKEGWLNTTDYHNLEDCRAFGPAYERLERSLEKFDFDVTSDPA